MKQIRRYLQPCLAMGCIAAAAACGDVRRVSVDGLPCGPLLAVGDAVYASAGAETYGGLLGSMYITSADQPGRFRWKSSAPDVLSVSANGLLVARAPGTATLTTEIDGVSASRDYQVAPASTGAVVTLDRATVRRGERVEARASAFGPAGEPLAPEGWPAFWTGTARVIHVEEGRPTGATVVALGSGTGTLNWCFAGRYGFETVTVR